MPAAENVFGMMAHDMVHTSCAAAAANQVVSLAQQFGCFSSTHIDSFLDVLDDQCCSAAASSGPSLVTHLPEK